MTLTGAHVRTIVVDDPSQNGVVGVVVSADLIAVGTGSGSICLFDWNSGALVRSFGEREKAEGLLGGIEGLQFTPDGSFVIVAEYYNNRLSLFTVTGEFVRCVGVGILRSPQDVGFTSSGDLLVADCNNHRICVFSPDGSTLLRSFGSRDDEPGQLKYPIALAMHNDALYVLGYTSAFVQVFT